MIIEYETDEYIKQVHKIEIEDTKNVFLCGKNSYYNMDSFFGIWVNDNTLSIVTIIGYRTINYKCYLNTNISTKADIQEYLRYSKEVRVISRDEFKEQIKQINEILKI